MSQNPPHGTFPADELSRRAFVGGLLSAAAASWLLPGSDALAAGDGADFWNPAPGPLAKRIVWTPERCYFAYPHSNGFLPDSTFVVARRKQGSETGSYVDADYLTFDPATGTAKQVAHVAGSRMYYSISDRGQMLVTDRTSALLVDLARNGATRTVYTAPPEWKLGDIYDLSPDGSMAVLPAAFRDPAAPTPAPGTYASGGRSQIILCDLARGTSRTMLDRECSLNHPHFSPFDPAWVAYCHEGSGVTDRIWTWNGREAAQGRMLFDQATPDGTLLVGHERAMFHKLGEIFVGYHPSKEAGLYEVGFDKVQRLISPSENYLHCNISRDGRWAVVDSQPVADPQTPDPVPWGLGDASHRELPRRSDVFIINMKTGAKQFLHAAAMAPKHPWHIHPHISPDGKWVVFNDYKEKKVAAVEIDQRALEAFLA